jgi:kanosamine 6-kinase
VGLDVRRAFGALFGGVPVRWADDGHLGALAEAVASGAERVLYVGVGTGVGGGLVTGGEGVQGPGESFEIGHVITDPDGPPCRCGRRGCLQATAGGPAVLARAERLRGAPVSYAELRAGCAAAEPWACAAVDAACRRLALAITGVQELLHPELVVVGGGFAAGLPGFTEAVATHLRALVRAGGPCLPVRTSRFGGLSALHGALALARMSHHRGGAPTAP